MRENRDNTRTEWGCIAQVLVAILTVTGAIIVAIIGLVPFFTSLLRGPTPTPVPPSAPTPTPPMEVVIDNKLKLPVDIFINESYQGQSPAQAQQAFLISNRKIPPSAVNVICGEWPQPIAAPIASDNAEADGENDTALEAVAVLLETDHTPDRTGLGQTVESVARLARTTRLDQ